MTENEVEPRKRGPKPGDMSQIDAHREARKRWGYRGVAIGGQKRMVGYFEGSTPDDPYARPPWPWVKCGEGATWREAFDMADSERDE